MRLEQKTRRPGQQSWLARCRLAQLEQRKRQLVRRSWLVRCRLVQLEQKTRQLVRQRSQGRMCWRKLVP